MKRLHVWLAVGTLALVACKKDEKAPAKQAPGIQHGKGEGKGTGGGGKSATGSMNGKPGSGKPPGEGAGTATPTTSAADLVKRGEYLATGVAGCVLCHTPMLKGQLAPDTTMMFAGGLEMPDVVGTWRAPNITPDPDTGLGNWTDEQIIAAIRQGVRPDGTVLSPVMPYPMYNRMTDEDAKAIVAFLRTVKPVTNAVVLSKNLPRPPQGLPPPSGNVDVKDDAVKHGEYLATLMHCAMCHTPMVGEGKDLRPDLSKLYAGGFKFEFPPEAHMGTGVLYSPNLTSDATGLAKWSGEDLVKAMRSLTRPDGRPILGPMMMYAGAWSRVTDDDIAAVVTFIKQLPPIANQVPASTYQPPSGAPPP